MMIPEAWQNDKLMPQDKKDFYRYHSVRGRDPHLSSCSSSMRPTGRSASTEGTPWHTLLGDWRCQPPVTSCACSCRPSWSHGTAPR